MLNKNASLALKNKRLTKNKTLIENTLNAGGYIELFRMYGEAETMRIKQDIVRMVLSTMSVNDMPAIRKKRSDFAQDNYTGYVTKYVLSDSKENVSLIMNKTEYEYALEFSERLKY